ncbi:hypothetical protein GCM10007385_04990 [Tateyamaria omphalii]|uniref:class D beta-lactamase n=1 Tax=Tateyamaria omphalii TaxID=299262 RepID=UPI00167432A3|nr:class D beta-lactamase [Tateyamaria omphalii]GGX40588.1 hypothetical protein GCM10007385_04990 [Tateyamaria omphalii]
MSSTLTNRKGGRPMARILTIFTFFLTLSSAATATEAPINISQVIVDEGVDTQASTVMVQRLSDGQLWVSNAERSKERFSPASSSKIPHTLIAIETGVATPDATFKWDGKLRWVEAWNRDHSLKSAFQVSAVWVYQEIARRAGSATMRDWLQRFNYGDANVGTEATLTTYWLDGTLRISATEQIAFLRQLAERDLPLSDTTYAAADEIMQADSGDGWTMYSKTGWFSDRGAMDIGWYVGWVRCSSDTYVFAMNMDMPNSSFRNLRISTAKAALNDIGAFDCQ